MPDSPETSPAYWQATHDRLAARPTDQLGAAELDTLAAALFWLNRPDLSIETHHLAFKRWQADGRPAGAVRSAWHLFYEHWLVGEAVVARGWLERGRRLLGRDDIDHQGEAAGWLAVAEADVSLADGRPDQAIDRASFARRIGERHGDADLVAMALQAEGRMLIAAGDREQGLARLDDAMVSVIGGELQALFTGWVYCNVIGTCHAVADLRRANEWSTAALRWCESLREGLLYPGLCRVYAAELAQLRGDWPLAEQQARQACRDLAAYDQRYAGAAHYLVGDLCRLQGRLEEAGTAYARANELGRQPQPGLALLRAQTGQLDEALTALRAAADGAAGGDDALLPSLQMLTALIDVAEQAGDTEALVAATDDITGLGRRTVSDVAKAYVHAAEGRAAAAAGDLAQATKHLAKARDQFGALALPYDEACQRLGLARLAMTQGDELTARLEEEAAAAIFDRLGGQIARPDPVPARPSTGTALDSLSAREREVLDLVANGLTNKGIAAQLHLSPHTVARHLANIFAKLSVSSRTAASALAVASLPAAGPRRRRGTPERPTTGQV